MPKEFISVHLYESHETLVRAVARSPLNQSSFLRMLIDTYADKLAKEIGPDDDGSFNVKG